MESINFTLIISNANEHTLASYDKINSSEVHRITLTNMSWIPGNMFTLPSQHLHPRINNIIPSDDPYRLCENVYLSVDPDTYRLRSIAYPVLVPDLSVDFILGTLFFDELNLKWSASLKRLITRSEEEEEARRQTYRRIL
ncbi:unnamed protein product [Rotaria socialis]|uniref:Uncharacterized protein n=1 Tax=Rotaria socialis TaxID=392032 RepID=A0A821ESV3_9BILA|nr:unnamed protein product [Rotaria socialis]